jgi:multiple sugar transport system substrate-binding protein
MNRKRIRTSAVTAVALSALLAACSSGGGSSKSAPKSSGPVTVVMWGWAEEKTVQPAVDKYNATHTDIQLKYVKQADNTGTAANLRNAVAAGSGVPCLVQPFGEVPSLAAEGLLTDITSYVTPYVKQGVFNKAALASAQADGKYFGVPLGFNPTFMIVNRKVYDQYGVAIPKTWDDVISAGKQLKQHGVYIMNLAGEDPSTLVNLVQQAGGSWYKVAGNKWQIGFTSPESEKAANVVQQLIDNNLAANQTYKDKPALIAYFDSGKMVSLVTQTWQLPKYETTYKTSLGNWEPVDMPQYSDASGFTTLGHGSAELVPKGCPTVKQAVDAEVWMATNKDAINASYDPTTKAYTWPGAVPDPSPWVDSVVPDKLFGSYQPETRGVVMKSVGAAQDSWQVGPNYTGVFSELQDQWAKAVTKQITMQQLLEHMQTFTVNDLKSKNINVEG